VAGILRGSIRVHNGRKEPGHQRRLLSGYYPELARTNRRADISGAASLLLVDPLLEALTGFLLQTALDEVSYTLRAADQQSIVYPDIVITLAWVNKEQGDLEGAIRNLQRAIDIQPTSAKAYTALAILYKRNKELAKAKEVLDKANEATQGESADVHYNLGLINLELGNVDAAVDNAREAYKLGYPLPWLKDKLKSMGRWE
jgi:tetratricopeptide (TPR) repeat protein